MSVATTATPATTPRSPRSKSFDKIREAYKDFNMSLIYTAPEIRCADYLRRNPIVLLNDMAKKVPEGADYDKFVEGFADLAFFASVVPLSDLLNSWWHPVGNKYLGDVIGECDCEWKEEAIKIWMDADYTKSSLN